MVGMTTGIPNLTKPRVAMRVTLATHQKLKHQSMQNIRGLGSANGIIKFVNYDEDVEDGNGQTAIRRLDGWMEIELGKFYYDLRDNGPVEARLLGNNFNTKVDIIVAGIELRMRVDTREFMRYDCVCSFKRKCEKLKKRDISKPEGLWICKKNNKK
ncbi:Phloem protein 2-like [Forsythia ovata]|uniref:Phloem protein 2-like n=1 Tax=Forsythia ovata TaxID=205694 RepID=A0ABD1WMU9_9LAMI